MAVLVNVSLKMSFTCRVNIHLFVFSYDKSIPFQKKSKLRAQAKIVELIKGLYFVFGLAFGPWFGHSLLHIKY